MRRSTYPLICLVSFFMATLLWSVDPSLPASTVYGPKKFSRGTGKPVVVPDTFSVQSVANPYHLIVLNGENGRNRVSSAILKINGKEILRESDFDQQVDKLERDIALQNSNSISVELRSAPGSFITVSITSESQNHSPLAQDQSLTIDEDMAKAITLVATDADGDMLTYTIVAQPGHGTLIGTPPSITYTPTAHYYGTDSFTFKANDGKTDSNTATVSITVNHVNHPPVAQDQSVTTDEDTAKAITLVATDPDGDSLSYSIVAQPTHGTLSGTAPNVTYTPTARFYGSDGFTFKANDGKADSNLATVSITVNHINHPPVAQNQSLTVMTDSSISIILSATDLDGDTLSCQIVTQPAHGLLSGTPPSIAYTPGPGYSGSDSFTFKVNDGKLDSNIASVSITVKENHPPVAQNQCVMIDQDTAKEITLVATDADGDPLIYEVVDQPTHGTLSGTPPNVTYMPASDYFGPDAFTFTANDGKGESNIATISISLAQDPGRSIISPVAGKIEPYLDDDRPAPLAILKGPAGVAVDAFGNLYIADARNNRIRKVDPNGIITTVAGNGTDAYGGDGDHAIYAMLSSPQDVAVDGSGNLYIADWGNDCVRRVTPDGIITTVAGRGSPSDDLGDGGPAIQAKLYGVWGVAVDDSGNLYTTDSRNGSNPRIRKVGMNGIITTVAGGGNPSDGLGDGGPATQAKLFGPGGIATDKFGNLYIADWSRIRKVDTDGIITTIAGDGLGGYGGDGGPATQAKLGEAGAVAVDSLGNLYIAESGNHRVRKVDTSGIITTAAGSGPCPSEKNSGDWGGFSGDGGPATQAMLDDPSGVAVDSSGNLYIADWGNDRVRKVDTSSIITTFAGGYEGEGGLAVQMANFLHPRGVAIDTCGNSYIADSLNNRVWKVDTNGLITTLAGSNDVCGWNSGGFNGDGIPATQAMLYTPMGVALDSSGNVYIADSGNNRIRKVGFDGIITTVTGNGSYGYGGDGGRATQAMVGLPEGVAVDTMGDVYIADTGNNRVRKLDTGGVITTVAGGGSPADGLGDGGSAIQAQLYYPEGVAVDALGSLYIADEGNNRIRKIDRNGVITTVAGIGPRMGIYPWNCDAGGYDGDGGPAALAMLRGPSGVAVDGLGNLYILDGCNNVIRRVDPNGTITTVAGNGSYGYSGDGGPSTQAMLSCNEGAIAVDTLGNLYIANDTGNVIDDRISKNNNVRKVVGLLKSATIIGKVTDTSTGLPLSDVSITLEDALGTSNATQTYSYATYALSGLPPGVFTVTFSKDRYIEQTVNGTLNASQTQTVDIQLTHAPSLDVAITSPQDGATVNSSPVTVTGSVSHEATVTVNGFRVPVTSNTFSVSIALSEGSNTIQATAMDQYDQITSQTIHVSLITKGSITGILTDSSTGLPLSSATVSVTDSLNYAQSTATDNSGKYTISAIASGVFSGTITKEGYTIYDFTGTIAPGQTLTINAALTPLGQTPPVISNIAVSGITMSSAAITWTTDQLSDSLVEYGTTTSYGSSAVDPTLTTHHTITLSNLTPATAYHFAVTSTSGYGLSSSSADNSFSTFTASSIIAYDLSLSTGVNKPKDVTLFANDPNGYALTYLIEAQPGHGALTGTQPAVTYIPSLYYSGPDSFTFKAYNGQVYSNVATVSITVSPIITTVAGNGMLLYSGDGGPATQAMLSGASDVAVDASGNFYIADYANHCIRKVDVNGMITTVAGDGTAGYAGDGGPATEANLNTPSGIAFDLSGNLYIADSSNHVIRKVDVNGRITTIAGNGINGYSGDGEPATLAMLWEPEGIALDTAGNLYIADSSNNRIRKVDLDGTITTVAGNGAWGYSGDDGPAAQAELASPLGIALDALGNLYIADSGNNRIRKVDLNGTITTVAGNGIEGYGGDGGPAAGAQLDEPSAIGVDKSGNLYIADVYNDRIRKVDTQGIITTVAGNGSSGYAGDGGPATSAMINSPWAVAVDISGNLYIADDENRRVRKVDTNGIITTVAGNGLYGYGGDGGPAVKANLNKPTGVVADLSGNFYIADNQNHRVRKVDPTGTITTLAGNGIAGYGGDGGPATQANLNYPSGVGVDSSGNVYIADTSNHRIRKVDSKGTITTVAGNGTRGYGGDGGPAAQTSLYGPEGVAADLFGNLYIADTSNHRIRKVNSSGMITTAAGNGTGGYGGDGGPATGARLHYPFGVVVDGFGNLYIADYGNYRIRKVNSSGIITTVAGNGVWGSGGDGGPATQASFCSPSGVAVDGSGDFYVADTYCNRVRKVDLSGIITTVAGGGGGLGDGGPATEAGLYYPEGVAVDAFGNLYIADTGNERIRKVEGIFMPPIIAEITGGVTAASTGLPLPDTTVTIKDSLNVSHITRTGSDGKYLVLILTSGNFTATFSKSGYLEQTVSGTVSTGETKTIDIQLTRAPALTMVITSPQEGATVNSSPVTVTGNLSHSANVTINGVQASVTNNTFSVLIPLNTGSNAIQATAMDQYGQTVSQTIHVTLLLGGDLAGTVTDSSTGFPLPSATVSVTDSQNVTQSTVTDNNGGFSISGVAPGAFTGSVTKGGYTARAFSGTMVSGGKLTLNAALSPIVPIITNISVSGITMNSATITWTTDQLADSLVEYGTTTAYGSLAADSTLTTSHTISLGSLTPSTAYHFRVTSKNGYGISSSSGDNSFATGAPNPITLVITLPSNNDTISRTDTLVKGTVTNWIGNETGVVVNGFIANVYGNEFVANHIPLVEGPNIVTVVATDTSGNSQTASVNLTGTTTGGFIKITSSVESGLSPLQATLTIDSSLDLTNAQLTSTGPGQIQYLSSSLSEYTVSLTSEGIYYFTVKVSDPSGRTYDDTVAVTVLSKIEMDNLLRTKWDWVRTKLADGDIEGALVFFDEDAKNNYRDLFNVLSTMLPTIAQDMSDIQLIEIMPNAVIYDIQTPREGITYSFQLLFTQDDNGLWRINSF